MNSSHRLRFVLAFAAAFSLLASCDSGSNSSSSGTPSPADTAATPAGTVSAPVFSPAGGTYSSAQSVALSSSTSGATIYYTTDGSTPTTSSVKYTSSVSVSANKTLKAIAVKNGMKTSSISSATYTISTGNSGSTISWNSSVSYGSLNYGGQTYKTVTIGTQTWMAENLNYKLDSSWCYANSADSCSSYGRLYKWVAMMNLPDSCTYSACASQIQAKHQGVCPSGWHIPGDAEWKTLADYLGGEPTAGKTLKSTSCWGSSWNGTDTYGFRGLPAGYRYYDGRFYSVGSYAYFWSSSEYDADIAWQRDLNWASGSLYQSNSYAKKHALSVRCLKD